MSEHRCPYCLQRVQNAEEASVVGVDDPLAAFIGLDEDATVHSDCHQNATDRA